MLSPVTDLVRGHAEPDDHAGMYEAADLAVDGPGLAVEDEEGLARRADHVTAEDTALGDRPVRVAPLGAARRRRLAHSRYHLHLACAHGKWVVLNST